MSQEMVYERVLPDAPDVALVTHGNVAVVAPQNHLSALGDDVTVAVDPGVHRSLRAAVADGLDLLNGVRHLHQAAAAGKQTGLEVRAQTEAHHRDVVVVNQRAELVDLAFRQELALVHDDHPDSKQADCPGTFAQTVGIRYVILHVVLPLVPSVI